ncbi:MAG: hypothetical protein ACE5HH_00660 [Candidatus Hydrothermarchaeales archaeon]
MKGGGEVEAGMGLSEEERKTLVEVLAFHFLEKSVTKHYKIRHLGRTRRRIKKKWKKLLPKIKEDLLVIERGADPREVRHVLDLLLLYSNLYSDIVDPYATERCSACIEKLRSLNLLPALAAEFEDEIDQIVAIKPGPKRKAQKPLPPPLYREYPHLNPAVRGRLVKYFKNELKMREPMVMTDTKFRLRIDNLIRRHVDRILDVSLEHGYKAMQFGYIGETTKALSEYVEEKGKESIDWMIKSGVLIEELAKGIQ